MFFIRVVKIHTPGGKQKKKRREEAKPNKPRALYYSRLYE